MDKVRGGVFSGAMLLAGLSATLLSALVAIGIRQVTSDSTQPVQVSIVPASGEVAVPDTAATAPAHPAAAVSPLTYQAPAVSLPARGSAGTTTGSHSSGATLARPPAPSTGPTASTAHPTPAPTPTKPGKGNGRGNGNAAGNGNGHKR